MTAPVTRGPWYRRCDAHAEELAPSRLPFEQALEIAQGCTECETGVGLP